MANPLPDEDKIYERIKKEDIHMHPLIWDLVNHHIRNDVYLISLAIDSLRLTPDWILKATSFFMKFLWRVFQQNGNPVDLIHVCDTSLNKVKSIDTFLDKLRKATHE